jgi:two-component system response regulator GlrR
MTSEEVQRYLDLPSASMREALDLITRVAPALTTVYIHGPSGSGKEFVARAVHAFSPRSSGPFIAVNCGAIPRELIESELFGSEKGAYTGSVRTRAGLIEAAEGGTFFLDEIGDMPLPLQVKLLRALQERQIRPVGSAKSIPIDVRLISATHRDLKQAMQEQSFREDLYYRLNVVNLQLPTLRERAEDIPLLARHVLAQSGERHHVQVNRFSEDAMQALVTAQWPGNVRQLVNVVEQCVALTSSPVISLALVEQALAQNRSFWPTLSEARDQFERQYLIRVLKMAEGVVGKLRSMGVRLDLRSRDPADEPACATVCTSYRPLSMQPAPSQ